MAVPRLLEKYRAEVIPKLKEKFGIENLLALPRLEKIVVNMGVGKALENKNRIDHAVRDLATITGKKPVVAKARRSVSGFRLRQGNPIGVFVTLRKDRMYEFLDRLISIAIPRIRDFRGLDPKGFDGHGNYNMGLSEQIVFPEINLDKLEFVQGMNVTIVTTAKNDEQGYELLLGLGMPFKRPAEAKTGEN